MPLPGRRGAAIALAPLLAGPALLGLLAVTGLTRRSAAGTPLDDVLHGYFLDRYPLFACLLAYGLARLVAVAALEPGRRRASRWVSVPLAAAALLAVSLHPTFGGFVLRPGFMAGGVAFQNGTPWLGAHLIGAGVAALVFGAVLGGGVALVRLRLALGWRPALRGLLVWAALWFACGVLATPGALGLDLLGGWPHRPLPARAALAAGLAMADLLPHALLAARGANWPDSGTPTLGTSSPADA